MSYESYLVLFFIAYFDSNELSCWHEEGINILCEQVYCLNEHFDLLDMSQIILLNNKKNVQRSLICLSKPFEEFGERKKSQSCDLTCNWVCFQSFGAEYEHPSPRWLHVSAHSARQTRSFISAEKEKYRLHHTHWCTELYHCAGNNNSTHTHTHLSGPSIWAVSWLRAGWSLATSALNYSSSPPRVPGWTADWASLSREAQIRVGLLDPSAV